MIGTRAIDTLDLASLRHLNGGHVGFVDVACPLCGPDCRTPSNRMRKVLRIWDDGDFVTYKCARCEASGWARDDNGQHDRPKFTKPIELQADRSELARFLWSKARAISGTLAETYLRSRQCFLASPQLRFLPGRGKHPPAMVARFGAPTITGVHLTKLKPDGSGKAGTENDKIMIGPSVGQPIIIHDNEERGDLLVAEGIEDAASLALATGWSAHAAGAAGRIGSVVAAAEKFDRVLVAIDPDRAGRQALSDALTARADVIPLHISKVLGARDRLDANKALIKFGGDALLAAIEWSIAKAAFHRGGINFHTMQREVARAETVFRQLALRRASSD